MSSLLDMGEMGRTVLGFVNLEETKRRNDIAEQNSLSEMGRMKLQQENLQLEKRKLQVTSASKAYDEITKLQQEPAFAMNPDAQIKFTTMRLSMLEHVTGQKIDLPTAAEMRGGYKELDAFATAIRSGDLVQAQGAVMQAALANPTWAKTWLEDMKKAGELTVQFQELDTKLKIHAGQLEKLNIQNARATTQQTLYTEHVGALGRVTGLAQDPRFKDDFTAILSLQKPEAREAYLKMHPAFAKEFDGVLKQEKSAIGFVSPEFYIGGEYMAPRLIDVLSTEVHTRSQALKELQAKSPDGRAPIEAEEELAGYGAVLRARQIEAEWLSDPFNKDRWKAMKKSEQDLRLLQKQAGQRITDIASERLSLSQAKFDQATQGKLKSALLQEEFIKRINAGEDDNQAYQHAIETAESQYKGVPFDKLSVENPARKGKLSVDLNEPTGATRSKIQGNILGIQSTRNIVSNLISTIDQGNIGLAAALKSTAYGFTAQIQGMAETVGAEAVAAKQKGLTPSKWFDPKIPTVDLLANTLAYRLINIEQGGRVSDKDIEEMRGRLNIKSWMAGKEDAITRLKEISKQLDFEESVYRRVMPTFSNEKPGGGAISTAEDYLKSIGFGAAEGQ